MEDNSTENAAGTRTGNSGGGDCKAQKKNPGLPSTPKSCKGYLLYNLLRHSKSKGLTCFGINGTYDKIPPRILRAADLKASERGASNNKNFMYACLGYSIYFDDKSCSQKKPPKVPYCLGVELIGYISATTTESKGRDHATPQPQGHEHATPRPRGNSKPAHVPVEEFLNRFDSNRNMGVVALGVAKNLKRTGNHVKKTLRGILNSNRMNLLAGYLVDHAGLLQQLVPCSLDSANSATLTRVVPEVCNLMGPELMGLTNM